MVWTQYAMCSAEARIRAAAYTTFLKYWRELAPHILVMKPMTDLCWVCQKNSAAIMKAKNTSDELKSEVGWLKNHTLNYHLRARQYVLQNSTLNWPSQRGHTTRRYARTQYLH